MSQYTVYVTPGALEEINKLPEGMGNVQQRVKQAISDLADDPHPTRSQQLTISDLDDQVFRLRIKWRRVVYVVAKASNHIYVLAVRKRPLGLPWRTRDPAAFGDLESQLSGID